ncbi:MAG: hypothetical protein OXP12_04795 [Thaumarchaeota archaeon]|nr:hypothetical protein [Nitrososphaerota archaeon]MDE0267205.1 hypothetical protein [Nitrososphaerota archaeon]MDE0525184.1 hypothetical protein [Nitrososphaerota archaeon]
MAAEMQCGGSQHASLPLRWAGSFVVPDAIRNVKDPSGHASDPP